MSSIDVVINGDHRQLRAGATISDAVRALGLTDRILLAELNGSPADRHLWATKQLAAGDRLEVVRIVAGG